MKLSVRLMCYNHEKFIEEALYGVDNQKTIFDFELVVGDDFSSDNTLEKVKAFKFTNPRLSVRILDRVVNDDYYLKRQEQGRLYNFVDTVNHCKGEFVALLDGDDYWIDHTKLQRQINQLEENPDATLSFHRVNVLKKDGSFVDDFITTIPDVFDDIYTLGLSGNYIHTPTVVFRNIISFPPEFVKVPYGDYFLYMLLAEKGKIIFIDEVMCVYRYQVGLLAKKSHINMIKDAIKLYSFMLAHFKDPILTDVLIKKQQGVVLHYVKLIELEEQNKINMNNALKRMIIKSRFYEIIKGFLD